MPLRQTDIEQNGLPIYFENKGEVTVRTGPCSSSQLQSDKIPLDGRHYTCAGTIILKNGTALQANFEISTHTFDFLERESVKIYIEKEQAWYYIHEDELFEILGVAKEDALPYTWLPDKPIDYSDQGPYPMNFYEAKEE